MRTVAERAKAEIIGQVFAYLRRHRITLDDLINIGGEDLESPNAVLRERTHRVEKSWSLIARLGVVFAELERAAPQHPVKPARRRRGKGVPSQALENTDFSGADPLPVKSLKRNDIRDSHSVEGSRKGRWGHKRRVIAPDHPSLDTELGDSRRASASEPDLFSERKKRKCSGAGDGV